MADGKALDPLVLAEQEVEVDAETAAAIERGIRAADEGRVVPADEVRKLIPSLSRSMWLCFPNHSVVN